MPQPSPQLQQTADAYDDMAVRYAEFVGDSLAGRPLDQAVFTAFTEYVRAAGGTRVADLGCGPGYLTAALDALGFDAFGVDVSPGTVALAREARPGLRLEVGSMDALDLPDDALDGVVSWYSLIHTPPHEVPSYLDEFRRVLTPGGHALIGFFESADDPVTPFDHAVTTAYRWPIGDLAELAGKAGFAEVARVVREPADGERFMHGRLLLRALQS